MSLHRSPRPPRATYIPPLATSPLPAIPSLPPINLAHSPPNSPPPQLRRSASIDSISPKHPASPATKRDVSEGAGINSPTGTAPLPAWDLNVSAQLRTLSARRVQSLTSDDGDETGTEWEDAHPRYRTFTSRRTNGKKHRGGASDIDEESNSFYNPNSSSESELDRFMSNGKGKGKASSSTKDLLLPSRTLSASSSYSSLVGRLASPSSSTPPPVPALPPFALSQITTPPEEIVIGVVGSTGCGKSSIVRKGMKAWGLSSENSFHVGDVKFASRRSTVSIEPSVPSQPVQILEIDSSHLSPSSPWPAQFPKIDALILCYDVSSPSSFASIAPLLPSLSSLSSPLPLVIVSTKSDLQSLPTAVPPNEAAALGSPYHVGLVQVSVLDDTGKRRSRDCFTWVIKAVGRVRRGEFESGGVGRNPASPPEGILDETHAPLLWHHQTQTPTPMPTPSSPPQHTRPRASASVSSPTTTSPISPSSALLPPRPGSNGRTTPQVPTRSRSASDLLTMSKQNSPTTPNGTVAAGSVGGGRGPTTSASVGSLRHRGANAEGPSNAEGHAGGEKDKDGTDGKKDRDEGGDGDGGGERGGTTVSVEGAGEGSPAIMRFGTLDVLLDRLFFLSVTDDDPVYIDHFFLTYRRFATPRSVLLGMQKRMIQLNSDERDPLLAKFAQMRICSVLENWMKDYPTDFAAPGALGALSAILKQIVTNVHMTHYASDLLPFLDQIPTLVDLEGCWALKSDDVENFSDEEEELGDLDLDLDLGYHNHPYGRASVEEEHQRPPSLSLQIAVSTTTSTAKDGEDGASAPGVMSPVASGSRTPGTTSTVVASHGQQTLAPPHHANGKNPTRSRSVSNLLESPFTPGRTSLGLGPAATPSTSTPSNPPPLPMAIPPVPPPRLRGPDAPKDIKANVKDLQKTANHLLTHPPMHIAEEITNIMLPLFTAIAPRDWLRHTLGKKTRDIDPNLPADPVTKLSRYFNYIVNWVSSLILAPDKTRVRAKVMETFIMVARYLRNLHNYAGMRAVCAGINNAKVDDDPVHMLVTSRDTWKTFQSCEVLLSSQKNFASYRLGLKSSSGITIPDLEIHSSELLRAESNNPDFHRDDPTKIHWGKFAVLGKIVLQLDLYRCRSRDSTQELTSRWDINDLFMNVIVMDEDMIYERSTPHSEHVDQSETAQKLRRFFFNR